MTEGFLDGVIVCHDHEYPGSEFGAAEEFETTLYFRNIQFYKVKSIKVLVYDDHNFWIRKVTSDFTFFRNSYKYKTI